MSHEGVSTASHGLQPPGHFSGQLYDERGSALAQVPAGLQSAGYLQHGDVSDATAAAGYLTHEAHAYLHGHRGPPFQVHWPDAPQSLPALKLASAAPQYLPSALHLSRMCISY